MPTSTSETKPRKKRPERQLYVPPAQRRQSVKSDVQPDILKCPKHSGKSSQERLKCDVEKDKNETNPKKIQLDNKDVSCVHKEITVEDYFGNQLCSYLTDFYFLHFGYQLSNKQNAMKTTCDVYFNDLGYANTLPVFDCNPTTIVLNVLNGFYALWQPKFNLYSSYESSLSAKIKRMESAILNGFFPLDFEFEHVRHNEEMSNSASPPLASSPPVIVLDERFKQENNKMATNITTTTTDDIKQTYNKINRTLQTKPDTKKNEHEEEIEIMRKTKQHIRKIRPIMKYMDKGNDKLHIAEQNNANNWEELYDDDGQLQEYLFKEIVNHKVVDDTNKTKEDYSEYQSKQVEELEHMVELYDFPPSFETHDLIQAFSQIHSDAIYVQWVDDTHAILVLGSLLQAQKAVKVENPLIKVRPMSAASSSVLEKAYKKDLKPAMKRPETNLQTARRLITSHLGKKSKVSQEQNAKERENLKAAKELKKLAKKNEQDAWEGKLRSSIK